MNISNSQNVNNETQIKKCKVKENWDDESEEESDMEMEMEPDPPEEIIKEDYNKNESEYDKYDGDFKDAEEPLDDEYYDDYDYDEIDKKLGNHFRLH